MDSATPEYSVVIPIYNEADNLVALVEEIHGALAPLGKPWEVLAVDDCSRDQSVAVLRRLKTSHPELRILRHRLNCGQSAAFATGVAQARGNVIITMDSDRQNDPADLPRMIALLTPDLAAVLGVRRRREDSEIRRWSSRLANWYRDVLTGVPVKDAGCFLRVLRRNAVAELPVFNGLHRFVPTLLHYQGHRFVEIEVNHRPRVAGKSNYGIGNRLWRGIRDCFAMRWYRARVIPAQRVLPEDSAGG
ncbi:MAG: glycosyltransferase family 2 protein [Verrucomicrobiales bacterium]|nr:glycosyltransferase family 2 protein [Verrucomicrobiales bacterium]